MTNTQDLLVYLGTDSGKWAAEFCKSARDKGLRYDEDLMRGWFAQAIMAGRIEGAASSIPPQATRAALAETLNDIARDFLKRKLSVSQ